MTTTTRSMRARAERRARMMKLVNWPMRRVLEIPFATPLSRRLMLVTHIGRRTGRSYRQPVSYIRDGEVLLTPGGGGWTRNLRDGEPVELRVAGHRSTARPERVREADEVERLLAKMLSANPRLASFVPFVGRDRVIDRNALATALDYGFCVVRWRVDEGSPR